MKVTYEFDTHDPEDIHDLPLFAMNLDIVSVLLELERELHAKSKWEAADEQGRAIKVTWLEVYTLFRRIAGEVVERAMCPTSE